MAKASALLLLVCFVAATHALSPRKYLESKISSPSTPYMYSQKLNHFDGYDTTRWNQQYFVNDAFWNPTQYPNSPIILYINGEGPVSGAPSNDSEVGVLAAKYHALIVTLEHRFYGKSQPKPDWSVDSLRYLSSRQALADLAEFHVFIQQKYAPGGQNKWITIGGSYSGALTAWYRLKYPHLTAAALSSSGVINAILEFTAFDEQVATSAGPDCSNILRIISAYMDEQLADPVKNTAIKMRFSNGLHQTMPATDGDFRYFFADAMSLAIQYGAKDRLCKPLLAVAGNLTQIVDTFQDYVNNFFLNGFGTWAGYATPGVQSITIDVDRADRQWWWQCCTEFSWFQPAPKTNSIRSVKLNMTYFQQHCADLFGAGTWPDVDATNNYYAGLNNPATNIVYANGIEDPWRHASALSSLGPTQPLVVADCYQCGHCVDLHTVSDSDSTGLKTARQQIFAYLDQFLNGDAAASSSSDSSNTFKALFIVFVCLFAVSFILVIWLYRRWVKARDDTSARLGLLSSHA